MGQDGRIKGIKIFIFKTGVRATNWKERSVGYWMLIVLGKNIYG